MWRTIATTAVSIIAVIFLPITFMGLILPINDYQAQGISGVADCDGPLAIMILIVPSLIIYAGGAFYYRYDPKRAEAQRSGIFMRFDRVSGGRKELDSVS